MSSYAEGRGEQEIHVLAVDDSSVGRALIAKILRSSNYRVTTVDSGKRALELLTLEPNISMIITDYWMPEMTGYELLKSVKVRVLQTEGDPRGRDVVGERPQQDQQVFGGRSRRFPAQARSAVRCVPVMQPDAITAVRSPTEPMQDGCLVSCFLLVRVRGGRKVLGIARRDKLSCLPWSNGAPWRREKDARMDSEQVVRQDLMITSK